MCARQSCRSPELDFIGTRSFLVDLCSLFLSMLQRNIRGDYNFNSQISDPEPNVSLTEISLIKDENIPNRKSQTSRGRK